jgi:hypothetical protein
MYKEYASGVVDNVGSETGISTERWKKERHFEAFRELRVPCQSQISETAR